MKNKVLTYLGMVLFLGLGGCATSGVNNSDGALESYNRTMFNVNNKIDKYVVRPVAKGYRAVTNEYVRTRVSNFFSNIGEPVSAVNHVLQGEFGDTGNNLGRFVINTTLGGVGLYDVASKLGLEKKSTGFDETLATWCVPDGPFIVLPLIGPSTPRATTGFVVDGLTAPTYWVAKESDGDDAWLVYSGIAGLKYVNLMAQNLTLLESLEEGSVDYYEAIKSTYMQNRNKLKVCGNQVVEAQGDYDFDMDIDLADGDYM